MKTQADVFYSLPEVWDFCLEKIYDKPEYVEGFIEFMKSFGISEKSLTLDAGCGSGFPSIDLIEKGYRIIGIDKSSEMVRQVQLNARKRGTSIEAYHVMWNSLSKRFDPIFDLVYCRGNSLVYAASWEQNWIVPSRSLEEISAAIKNFYEVLKPGGILYVDITNRNENLHEENIGTVNTMEGPVGITWKIEHDYKNKIRTWTIALNFLDSGIKRVYPSYSYYLDHRDLVSFFREAGFRKVDEDYPVKGEKNYNVYVGHK